MVSHSTAFALEQLHSTTASLTKAERGLRRLAREQAQPERTFREPALRRRIQGLLAPNRVGSLLECELTRAEDGWRLHFDLDAGALQELTEKRLGRTTLVTNRMEWSARQVVGPYAWQEHVEQVLVGLTGERWACWGPMHHWTEGKIKVNTFYCMLAVSLLQHLWRRAE